MSTIASTGRAYVVKRGDMYATGDRKWTFKQSKAFKFDYYHDDSHTSEKHWAVGHANSFGFDSGGKPWARVVRLTKKK